jgi:3-hydroxyisobutyrate dehydrogenase-like beta-hydroxyacid dehydrogenase
MKIAILGMAHMGRAVGARLLQHGHAVNCLPRRTLKTSHARRSIG